MLRLFFALALISASGFLFGTATAAPPFEPLVRAPGVSKPAPRADAGAVDAARLKLRSSSLLVIDQTKARVVVAREPRAVKPIASITKLMTAMVTLDAKLPLNQPLTIGNDDVDRLKGTHSRLAVGTKLSRRELLHLALMASENRAASALSRHYPGGRNAFIAAMNRKAKALGMSSTRFEDPTGLTSHNVSTAQDLARMVSAALRYALIREFTTAASHTVAIGKRPSALQFRNSNRLVQSGNREWRIGISKTGYTAEAGRCLVMQARIGSRPIIMVLLNSWGKLTPVGDANRIRRYLEAHPLPG